MHRRSPSGMESRNWTAQRSSPPILHRHGCTFILPSWRDSLQTRRNSDLNRAEDASPDGSFSWFQTCNRSANRIGRKKESKICKRQIHPPLFSSSRSAALRFRRRFERLPLHRLSTSSIASPETTTANTPTRIWLSIARGIFTALRCSAAILAAAQCSS